MERSLADLLIEARDVIADPAHWCKGSMHKDAEGMPARACVAVAHCAYGAVTAVDVRPIQAMLAWRALDDATAAVSRWGCTPDFNDHHTTTHADVMDLFDRAIHAATDGGS